ncbi:MAG: branched-chain amino acid ABC transporter permease, partial [Lachnospiraceae bacterium]|nr:branched-chain amino acid ABC transporter permease [Lachnospiraceae bacterium]
YPASKLRYAFLSLATIAFNEIVYQVITHSPGGITGDFLGVFAKPISIFGFEFSDYTAFYYLGLVFVVLFILAKLGLVNSRVGRALQAVKQNPHAAEGMGVNVRKYKVVAFAVSAFYCAFAGGMYAALAGYISPDTFQRTTSVQFLVMLLLGGSCSVAGPIIGSTAILIMNEFLRSAQQYQLLVYGAIILLVIMVMPRGLLGEATALIKKLTQKRTEKSVSVKGGVGNA